MLPDCRAGARGSPRTTTGPAGSAIAPCGPRGAVTPRGRRPRGDGAACYFEVAVALPPAASIFSLAEPENLSAVTSSLTSTSPPPSTLTGCFGRTSPLAAMSFAETSPPSGKALARSPTLTTW